MESELDDFIDSLGNPGRLRIAVILMVTTNIFPVAFHELGIIFYGITPPHHCKLPDDWSWSINESIPEITDLDDGLINQESCHLYSDPRNFSGETIFCPNGWEYTLVNNERTIVNEWDLVCDREYLVGLAATIYFAGMVIAGPVLGIFTDKVGRRPIILLCLYISFAASIISTLIGNFPVFLCLRFILGVCMEGLYTASTTLNLEMVQSKLRTVVGCLMEAVWPVATSALALTVYLVQDWRYVQLILTCPSVITIVYIWWLPESVRWLISQHKVEEAAKVSEKYLKYNKDSFRPNLRKELDELADLVAKSDINNEGRNYGVRDLFDNKKMTIISCVSFVWWITTLNTFCGLAYSIPKFGGNFYISFYISSAMEFLVVFAMMFILKRFGRKYPLMLAYLLTGCCCLIIVFIELEGSDHHFLRAALVIGKILINITFNILPIYCNELFPTVLRNTGMGMDGFCAQLGAMIAPPIALMSSKLWGPFPFVLYAVTCLICGLLCPLLPETLGKAMPETLEDVKKLWNQENPECNKKTTSLKTVIIISETVTSL